MKDYQLRNVSLDEIEDRARNHLKEMYTEFEEEMVPYITDLVKYTQSLEQDRIDLTEFLFDVLRKRDFADNEHDAAEGLHDMGARARKILTQMGHIK